MATRSGSRRVAPEHLLLLLAVGLSGFSALVYELLWTRMLALTFGTTMPAVSVVAATFMAGLAGGSLLFGRRADRSRSPLRLFAWLELGIALAALLFPAALDLATDAYVALMRSFPHQDSIIFILRLAFAALLILPPTICMGGTFPVVCRHLIRTEIGTVPGRIYAINTLGAAAGAIGTGFFLLPGLGVDQARWLAVGLNVVTALVALAMARATTEPARREPPARQTTEAAIGTPVRTPLIAIATIGALALALEIFYTRLMLLFLGATGYAFAIVLGVFLVGIATGGAMGAALLRRVRRVEQAFVLLILLMGVSVLASAPFYDRLADLFQAAHKTAAPAWGALSLLFFAITALTVLAPAVCSGALLPVAIALQGSDPDQAGRAIGRTVLANTLGAIAGSLLATFVVLPAIGLQGGFRLAAGCCLLLGAGLALRLRRTHALGWGIPALALVMVPLLTLPWHWDQGRLNAGVYIYSYFINAAGGLDPYLANFRLVEVVEGRDATVAVRSEPGSGNLTLSVNGKVDASIGTDMATQQLLGHLPLMLHRDPQKALVIGLGSGITLGAVNAHPLRAVRCAEISGEVIRVAPHFAPYNHQALADPRVELVEQDARNLLLVEPERYDVIISEPSNPWQTGNANLFTDEFYRLAVTRLQPGGVFCQWVPLYDMTAANLRTVLATLQKHLPHTLAFIVPASADLILVASERELPVDYARLGQRMQRPTVQSDLTRLGIASPAELLSRHFLMGADLARQLAAGAPLNTDNNPELEFSYPELFTITATEHQALLERASNATSLPLSLGSLSRDAHAAALDELAASFKQAGRPALAERFRQMASAAPSSPH